jgi:hypothetical protein
VQSDLAVPSVTSSERSRSPVNFPAVDPFDLLFEDGFEQREVSFESSGEDSDEPERKVFEIIF